MGRKTGYWGDRALGRRRGQHFVCQCPCACGVRTARHHMYMFLCSSGRPSYVRGEHDGRGGTKVHASVLPRPLVPRPVRRSASFPGRREERGKESEKERKKKRVTSGQALLRQNTHLVNESSVLEQEWTRLAPSTVRTWQAYIQ